MNIFTGSSDDATSSSSSRKTALVTGSVALGALITSAVLEKARHRSFPSSAHLPPAVDATVREMEIMEGRARYYYRAGTGRPVVSRREVAVSASSGGKSV